nr:MAG TPA: Transcription factor COE1 DNA-binding domain [Caudoviricetes sp.]
MTEKPLKSGFFLLFYLRCRQICVKWKKSKN